MMNLIIQMKMAIGQNVIAIYAKQISDLEFERCLNILTSHCQKMSTADKLLASEIDNVIDTNKSTRVHNRIQL